MSQKFNIGVFAQNDAKKSFLQEVLSLAGFKGAGGDVDLILTESACLAEILKKHPDQKILVLGGEDSENPNIFPVKIPARAATIIDIIKNIQNDRSGKSYCMQLYSGILDVLKSLWIGVGKDPIKLTEKEVAILSYLAKHKGESMTKEEILSTVWDYADTVETHTLETTIYRLRQKIENDPSSPKIVLTKYDGYAVNVGSEEN